MYEWVNTSGTNSSHALNPVNEPLNNNLPVKIKLLCHFHSSIERKCVLAGAHDGQQCVINAFIIGALHEVYIHWVLTQLVYALLAGHKRYL